MVGGSLSMCSLLTTSPSHERGHHGVRLEHVGITVTVGVLRAGRGMGAAAEWLL